MIYWDFDTKLSLGLAENVPKNRKYPLSGSSVGKKCLIDGAGAKQQKNNHSLQPRYVEEHL